MRRQSGKLIAVEHSCCRHGGDGSRFPLCELHMPSAQIMLGGTTMKYLIAVFALLLVCVPNSAASEQAQAGPEETLNSWASAWRTGDVDKMLSFYKRSKDIVAIASSGHRYDGAAGVRKMYEEAFSDADWKKVELRGVKVLRNGDFAWTTCRFQAEILVKPDNTKLLFTSQGSVVLQRSGSRWIIVLEHFSPIVNVPRIQPKE